MILYPHTDKYECKCSFWINNSSYNSAYLGREMLFLRSFLYLLTSELAQSLGFFGEITVYQKILINIEGMKQ